MKEILEKILSGEYDFGEERLPLSFSCDEIYSESLPDMVLRGSFNVYAADGAKGYIYSDDLRIIIEEEEFEGKNCEIRYSIDTHGLPHGAVREGRLLIVSDHGEYELPWKIVVSGSLPDSSMGEIRNLFHFANLAKADWNEAQDLFYSPAFKNVLEGSDKSFITAYRGFSHQASNSANMEMFLEVSRKKTRPEYAPETERVDMVLPRKSMRRHLKLVKEGWGFSELHIECRGDFLYPEKDVLTDEDFSGNVAEIPYVIEREALIPGENLGEIIVKDRLDEFVIPVCVNVPCRETENAEHKNRAYLCKLYLAYRTGAMTLGDFVTDAEKLIDNILRSRPDDLEYRLYQAQMLVVQKRFEEAQGILDRVAVLADENGVSTSQEAYRLYMQSLCSDDDEYKRRLCDHVKGLYFNDEGNWRLAWAYMSMDPDFEGNEKKKWRLIKDQYVNYGNASPIMLLEAYHIIVQEPKRMEEIGEFELALIHFALKRGIMTREMKERFALLSMEVHSYSEEMCSLLKECYYPEESIVLLEAITLHLMRGNKSSGEHFKWYKLAVDRELRLSRLYEYYVMSAPLDYKGSLPRIVLMYFAYRSPLDVDRNAFLYANVLRHKNEYQELYEQYLPVITAFAKEQILKGRVDDNLGYIYKKLLSGRKQEQELTDAYTELMFTMKIRIKHPGVVNLVLVYEHLKDEQVYPLYLDEVYIPVYGDHYCLFLEDEWGNRYIDESMYDMRPLLKEKPDSKRLTAEAQLSVGGMLSLAEQGGDSLSVSRENAAVLLRLSECDEINEDYRLRIRIALAEFYFDNDDIAPLDELLGRFEPLTMDAVDRERCIRIMVARGFYEEAFEWIKLCGCEGIDIKILVRLCDRLMARNDMEYIPEMLKLCCRIMAQGRYDEEVLLYLLRYGKGTLKGRKELWRAADSFGLDVQDLLESMMLQVLFTGADIDEKAAIYLDHLSGGVGAELERAYLARLCYDHFILQKNMEDKVFERAAQLYRLEEPIQTVCVLGWLKKAADHIKEREFNEDEIALCREFLEQMHVRDIFLPFFTAFSAIDPLCRVMAGQSFIEYRGHKDSQVVLHYAVESGSEAEPEYRREEMQHIYEGIYVKRFSLFYGERIHYYITEEDGRNERLTRSALLEYRDDEHEEGEDRFTLVNNMAIARDMNDEITFLKLMEDYNRQSYLTEALFIPAGSGRGGKK
ncbi:MAG: hypothetical protein IKR23_12150 [Lachnospiraceae bacterium]|nr:hypothetical protein [Lachnospiraceae bacterium]